MRILVDADRTKLAAMMDTTNLRLIEQVQQYADVEFHGPGWPGDGRRSILAAEDRFRPDVVLYWGDLVEAKYGTERFAGAERLRTPTILNIQDHWHEPDFRKRVIKEFKFKAVLTRWIAGVQNTYPDLGRSVLHLCLPHAINSKAFWNDRATPKKYDILVSGAMYPSFYPNRLRLRNIALALANEFDVHVQAHPGYWTNDVGYSGDGQGELGRLFRESRVCVVGTIFEHAIRCHPQKLWEVPACGSLSFSDLNPLDADYPLLSTHTWQVDMGKTDGEIADSLRRAIEASDRIAESWVPRCEYASLNARARQLTNMLDAVVQVHS
jgi:hypothetical protein